MNDKADRDTQEIPGMALLPTSIKPRRDLWPGIAARLTSAGDETRKTLRPRWQGRALAASVAIAFAAGIILGRQMTTGNPVIEGAPLQSLAMQAALEQSEREYRAAFREFIPVNTAGPELEMRVVDSIESSWADMQQAESALRAALYEYPDNIYLNKKLLDLRSQQLAFMKQMAMLDQFSRRKI